MLRDIASANLSTHHASTMNIGMLRDIASANLSTCHASTMNIGMLRDIASANLSTRHGVYITAHEYMEHRRHDHTFVNTIQR